MKLEEGKLSGALNRGQWLDSFFLCPLSGQEKKEDVSTEAVSRSLCMRKSNIIRIITAPQALCFLTKSQFWNTADAVSRIVFLFRLLTAEWGLL